MYLIANQSLTTNSLWGGIQSSVYLTKLCHYKFSSGWDPPLSQIRFLFGVGSSANRSDFLKRSLSRLKTMSLQPQVFEQSLFLLVYKLLLN